MYIIGIPKMTAHKIHRSLAGHHAHNGKIRNPENAVIDGEGMCQINKTRQTNDSPRNI